MDPSTPSSPCLFDLQVNGFAGIDFHREDLGPGEMRQAVEGLHAHQMQRILLTLVTDTIDAICRKLERCESNRAADPLVAETVVGYHIEGPYMSPLPGFHGAHPSERMKAPSIPELDRMQAAAQGRIRLITLAPEWPGSDEFIAEATRRGIIISIGHSDASEAQIDMAIRAGASLATHVGNGCPQLMHRHDNIIQRVLARDELTACLIPDGIHIPPGTLKNFFRAKPRDKVIITTDCMAAAGAPPGTYTVGGTEVCVGEDRVVRKPGEDNFAGSALTLECGVANLARWTGISECEARHYASSAVAEIFNIKLPAASGSAAKAARPASR